MLWLFDVDLNDATGEKLVEWSGHWRIFLNTFELCRFLAHHLLLAVNKSESDTLSVTWICFISSFLVMYEFYLTKVWRSNWGLTRSSNKNHFHSDPGRKPPHPVSLICDATSSSAQNFPNLSVWLLFFGWKGSEEKQLQILSSVFMFVDEADSGSSVRSWVCASSPPPWGGAGWWARSGRPGCGTSAGSGLCGSRGSTGSAGSERPAPGTGRGRGAPWHHITHFHNYKH